MKRPNDIKDLQREIQRLQEAKRRALSLAERLLARASPWVTHSWVTRRKGVE
jgi:hypothetical protein